MSDIMKNISEDMFLYIQNQLKKIEKENNITILYAVESGSRGWGFSNEESDYDVRFIFKRQKDSYLTIKPPNDTIDYFDGDLDFVGWDIKKVLYLHWKSNPNLREWMKQEIIYYGNCDFLKDLPSFNKDTLKHHYASIAYNNWKKFVVKENAMTKKVTKTYLYALRCIFSWMLIDKDIDAPLDIDKLMNLLTDSINPELFDDIKLLINFYRSNCKNTKPSEQSIENISKFIDDELKIMKSDNSNIKKTNDIEIYNKKFREIIKN